MDQDFIRKSTSIVEANLSDEKFGPEQLSESLGLSHSTVHRHIKKATDKTISRFIRDIRLEHACQLLISEESTISEVAYKVGFGSVTYFNRCFRERYRCSPGQYKELNQQKPGPVQDQKKGNRFPTFYIASFAVLSLILVFFILTKFHVFTFETPHDKSVAVLPFVFSGENSDKNYMCKAMEDNIKSSLSKIRDLRVVSVSPAAQISQAKLKKQVDVSYFLKGNVYQNGTKLLLAVTLLNAANDRITWSETYDLRDLEILSEENQVALTIARKLNAEITPEEKNRIKNSASFNPEANDFYQKGKNDYIMGNLKNAKENYRKACTYDSTFAQAYAGLASIAYDELSADDLLQENYIDTLLWLADKALSFDNTLAEAHTVKAYYYSIKDQDKAVKEYERALLCDPNYWQAYTGLGNFYMLRDNIKAIENFTEALHRRQGPEFGIMLLNLRVMCIISGLFEQAEKYIQIKIEFDNDSLSFYDGLAFIEEYKANFPKAIDLAFKGYKIDSGSYINDRLAFNFVLMDDYKNAFLYLQKYLNYVNISGSKNMNNFHRFGYIYLKQGDTITASKYFRKQIEACESAANHPRNQKPTMLYDLAATYSILNEKEKALDYLSMFKNHNSMPWFFYFYMNHDPLLDNIRNEAEFREIFQEVKERAFKERDSLQKWFDKQESM